MKQPGEQLFEQIFGDQSFRAPAQEVNLAPGDYCVKCKELVAKLPVIVPGVLPGVDSDERNLFYCNNHSCEHFGVLTVVIKRIK
jgi:hypothetical protein